VETNAHLLKYDSIHGTLPVDVRVEGDRIIAGDRSFLCTAVRDPKELPHREMDVQIAMECTGIFADKEKASAHLDAGAKRVIVSAPASGADKTIVYGVNHDTLTSSDMVISNASCTTNCLSPVAKVLNDAIGIEKGIMTTIHSYTGDQPTLDRMHKDLYRARAAAMAMIPTSTGAAKALKEVLPELEGKLDGTALRVPTPTGSLTDFTATLKKPATVEEINAAFAAAAKKALKGVLKYTEDPIVSSDIVTDPHSCVFDAGLTMSMGKLVKINGWYDNEWGYSNRLVDLTAFTGSKIKR